MTTRLEIAACPIFSFAAFVDFGFCSLVPWCLTGESSSTNLCKKDRAVLTFRPTFVEEFGSENKCVTAP